MIPKIACIPILLLAANLAIGSPLHDMSDEELKAYAEASTLRTGRAKLDKKFRTKSGTEMAIYGS